MIHYGWVIFAGLTSMWFGYMWGNFVEFSRNMNRTASRTQRNAVYKEIDKRAHERYLARLKLLKKND